MQWLEKFGFLDVTPDHFEAVSRRDQETVRERKGARPLNRARDRETDNRQRHTQQSFRASVFVCVHMRESENV